MKLEFEKEAYGEDSRVAATWIWIKNLICFAAKQAVYFTFKLF